MAEQQFPEWAITLIADIGNGDPNRSDPGATKQDDGWGLEKPFLQYMNWLQNLVGVWIKQNNTFNIQGTGYTSKPGETIVVDNETGSRIIQLPLKVDILNGQWVRILAVDLYSDNGVLVHTNSTADIMVSGDDEIQLDMDFGIFTFYWDETADLWKIIYSGTFGRAP